MSSFQDLHGYTNLHGTGYYQGDLDVSFPFINLGFERWANHSNIECTIDIAVQPCDFGLEAKLRVIPIMSLEIEGKIHTDGLSLRELKSPEEIVLHGRFGVFRQTAHVSAVDSPTEVIRII